MSNKIGENLVRLGIMKDWQVRDVLLAQEMGDPRVFGEIAIEMGYIDEAALMKYVWGKKSLASESPTPGKKHKAAVGPGAERRPGRSAYPRRTDCH